MNKFTLGTIVGTAALGLVKAKSGGKVKLIKGIKLSIGMNAEFNFSIPFQIRNRANYRDSVFQNIDNHTKNVEKMLQETFPEFSITGTASLSDMFNTVHVYFGMNDYISINDERIVNSNSEEIFGIMGERFPEDVNWETDSLSQGFREVFQLIRINYPELPNIKTDGFKLGGMVQDVVLDEKGKEYKKPETTKPKLRVR